MLTWAPARCSVQRGSVRRRHRGHSLPRLHSTVLALGWAPMVRVTRLHRSNPPEPTPNHPATTLPYPRRMHSSIAAARGGPSDQPCVAALALPRWPCRHLQRFLHLLCVLGDDGHRQGSPVPQQHVLLSARFAHTVAAKRGACGVRWRRRLVGMMLGTQEVWWQGRVVRSEAEAQAWGRWQGRSAPLPS